MQVMTKFFNVYATDTQSIERADSPGEFMIHMSRGNAHAGSPGVERPLMFHLLVSESIVTPQCVYFLGQELDSSSESNCPVSFAQYYEL